MAITRVQKTYTADVNTGTSLASASITTTTGNTVVIMTRISGLGGNSAVSGISDGTNTYTVASANNTSDPNMEVWTAVNITGVTGAITVTWATTKTYRWIYVVEYSGVSTTPVDVSGANLTSSATDLVTSAFSAAESGEVVVVGASQNALATYTAGTDFTLLEGSITNSAQAYGGTEEYITTTQLSSYTAHITSSQAAQYGIVWVLLKPSAAAPATGVYKGNQFFQLLGVGI